LFADSHSKVREVGFARDTVIGDTGVEAVRGAVVFIVKSFQEMFHRGITFNPAEDIA
jgi:hypothetical protein